MNEKQEEIARTIVEYLRKNQDAGDTLEGIARWWLESQRVDCKVHDVSEAVNMLVEKGLLKKVKLGDNTLLFKLAGK